MRHYFASWSFATVVYKALVMSDGLSGFYPDLAASDFEAPLAVFHSRFSTNTTPAWERAQPFRYLCHNGEINTLRGNEHRMAARGRLGTEEARPRPRGALLPAARPGGLRLRQARRRSRTPRRRRARHPPRRRHARPRGVGGQPGPAGRGTRLLPLPRLPGRAVGRPRRPHLHRRPPGRRGPRPQRAAAAALPGLRRRVRGLRLRGRGGADRRPRQGAAGPARPGPDALHRPRRAGEGS